MPENLPPETNQPQQFQKINWKNVLIGVLVGILLIGGGVAVWLLLGNPSTSLPSKTPTATPPAETSTPSSQIDETADWKTYEGETIPVSFKIPSNYSVEEQKGKIANTFYEGLITVKDEKGESVFSVVNSASFPLVYPLKKDDIVIDGVKGTKTSWVYYKDPKNLNSGPEDRSDPRFITISFDEKDFYISSASYSKDNEELMNKVLSTFRFD